MIRYTTRIMLRLGIVVLIVWGIFQSCIWMNELSGERDYYGYPRYNRNNYRKTYNNRSSTTTYRNQPSNNVEDTSYDTYY